LTKVLKGDLKPDKKMSNPSEQDLHKLVNLINDGRKKIESTKPAEVPAMLIDFIVSKLSLPAYLQKKYKDDYEDRIENIQEFLLHAKDVASMPGSEALPIVEGIEQQQTDGSQETLDQFLATIVLDKETDSSEKGDETPRVTISTIHSAKGLEWPVVFIPATYEGSIPHSRSEDADEERRLLYVAMTRAQALLTLTLPLQQSREQEKSTLTSFLPENIHHRLRDRGPVFSDEVIADIATVLRRDMPTQEALTLGLQSISDRDSAEDNIWPANGSHKVVEMQPLVPLLGQLPNKFQPKYSSSSSAATWKMKYGTGYIVDNTSSISTSNMSMGFTTARQQFRENPQPAQTTTHNHSTSDPEPSRKKPKLEKSKSSQGSIASFFSKPASNTKPIPAMPSESEEVYQAAPTRPLPRSQSFLPPSLAASLGLRTTAIPTDLAQHKLGLSSGRSGAFKRPRPALEPTSPNSRLQTRQTEYVILSSSPPPENKSANTDVEEISQEQFPVAQNALKPAKHPLTNTLQSDVRSVNADSTKKTLGIRRTMGGWDARRNK
jgi:DNA helicase II / ATP-dependent DNA helicase PcrA